ncbi:DUF418 domain-containing protein [Halosquirtibacter laminarini]|uniref:DUF418 domain-containing protein n=1 Tax=Halosquirtibacter laminarini TaxID=3374600 RepID=A0AC61NNY8_9BACT|nr:DUF418 domain-containing protein [Prolixibacteraceae bacterium]
MEKNRRIEVVDALRGMAIFSILLLHCSNHFLYGVMPTSTTHWGQVCDQIVKQFLYFLFEGKMYGVFAVLFGFTFGLQYYKAVSCHVDFRWTFLWRILLLSLFGVLNAAFFSGGDPLVFMAIVAVFLPFIAKLNTRTLLCIALFFLLQPFELFQGINHYIGLGYTFPKNTGKLYETLGMAVENSSFMSMAKVNMTLGLKACLTWAVEYGRAAQTASLYIVGFLFCRYSLFENLKSRFWNRLFLFSLVSVAILFCVKGATSLYDSIATALGMWYNYAFILLWISTFVILYRGKWFRQLTGLFQIYGRMSLTNFVSQSMIGTFLFYPYGLNLASQCGLSCSVVLGACIALVQMFVSYWVLRRFKQGPLEYVWHRATYFLSS